MRSTIYKFDHKLGLLDEKYFGVRDYFQYYTTGVESITEKYFESFDITTRADAESADNIMYDIFGDEDLGDTFIAINNQNYLWATPFGLDAFQDAIDFRMNYIELLMRTRIIKEVEKDENGNEFRDVNNRPIYHYNNVGQECIDKASEDIHNEDDTSRTIIIPSERDLQFIDRKIKDYFKSRKVE